MTAEAEGGGGGRGHCQDTCGSGPPGYRSVTHVLPVVVLRPSRLTGSERIPPFQHTVCVWGVEVASRCSFGNEDDCGALRNGRLSFWLEVKHQGSISLPWSDSWRGHRGFLLLLFSNISSVEILHTPACVFASLSWYF